MTRKSTDDEFIAAWTQLGSPTLVGKRLGISSRSAMMRRRSIEARYGLTLATEADQRVVQQSNTITHAHDQVRSVVNIRGTVIVFSDAHYMPGEPSIGHQALLVLIKRLKPALIIANGDLLDGGSIHNHQPIGWETGRPTLRQELDALIKRMDEVRKATKGMGTILHRTIGNHDIRFDKRLAAMVPEYKDIGGTQLKDHLPEWSASWSALINDSVMVKHRLHSGLHSTYNNVLRAGLTAMVCGHTHMLEVKPIGNYRGRHWGVSTGMLADPSDGAFLYREDAPVHWCQGFAVLTFSDDGRLRPPELCEVIDHTAYFRGSIVDI